MFTHHPSVSLIGFHSSDGFELSPPLDGSLYDEQLDEPPEFVPKMLSELSVKKDYSAASIILFQYREGKYRDDTEKNCNLKLLKYHLTSAGKLLSTFTQVLHFSTILRYCYFILHYYSERNILLFTLLHLFDNFSYFADSDY